MIYLEDIFRSNGDKDKEMKAQIITGNRSAANLRKLVTSNCKRVSRRVRLRIPILESSKANDLSWRNVGVKYIRTVKVRNMEKENIVGCL